MLNLGILDLIIGLFFIYFILSVICTSLVEIFAQWKNLRANSLNDWIKDTFNTPEGGDLGNKIINHGLVDGLTKKGRIASFIPSGIFSSSLFDIIYQKYASSKKGLDNNSSFDSSSLRQAILESNGFIPEDLKRYMLQAIDECKDTDDEITCLKKKIESWYENAMDRLTGTYKKRVRYITIVVATIVTVTINADTIAITKFLKDNPQQAKMLSIAAEKVASDSTLYRQAKVSLDSIQRKFNRTSDSAASSLKETLAMVAATKRQSDSLYNSLASVGLPIGWGTLQISTCTKNAKTFWGKIGCYANTILSKLVGWLATIAALILGAPFWFDIINKVVNIRSAGRNPSSSKR